MINGIDTDFLVAIEIIEHPSHGKARELLNSLILKEESFALAPQVLAEFVHVVTDARRLPIPLSMDKALSRAEYWWRAKEVIHVFPTAESTADFLVWIQQHRLGRKRLLDAMLGATYFHAEVRRIITNNGADFRVFGVFEIVGYS